MEGGRTGGNKMRQIEEKEGGNRRRKRKRREGVRGGYGAKGDNRQMKNRMEITEKHGMLFKKNAREEVENHVLSK